MGSIVLEATPEVLVWTGRLGERLAATGHPARQRRLNPHWACDRGPAASGNGPASSMGDAATLESHDDDSSLAHGRIPPWVSQRARDDDRSFLFFPEGDDCVVAAHAVSGSAPIYYVTTREFALVATTLTAIRQRLAIRDLDPLVTAMWMSSNLFFPEGRTFLRDVKVVPRGHLAVIRRGSVRLERFWKPTFSRAGVASRRRRQDLATHLREVIIGHLDRELPSDEPALLTLSGGVDSSALGAIATRTLGRSVATYTSFTRHTRLAKHDERFHRSIAAYARFTGQWGAPRGVLTRIRLSRFAPKVAFPILHPALCALPILQQRTQFRTLFGGEWADDVCGGRAVHQDWLRHQSFLRTCPPWGWAVGPKDPARWLRNRARLVRRKPVLPFSQRLRSLVRPELQAEFAELRRAQLDAYLRDEEPWAFTRQRLQHDGFLAMNWEACSAIGVKRVMPFAAREVMDWLFSTHPSDHMGPGDKRLLRKALEGDVPALNLQRRDKGFEPRSTVWGQPPPPHPRELSPLLAPIIDERMASAPDAWDVFYLWMFQRFARVVAGESLDDDWPHAEPDELISPLRF